MKRKYAFTLMEMLVVIAVIAILAALLFPAIRAAKARAKRMACLNNLRQISLGMRMYADDHHDTLPNTPSTNSPLHWYGYKTLMKSYVGLNCASSSKDQLFACPADVFCYWGSPTGAVYVPHGFHETPATDHSSYYFNADNSYDYTLPGEATNPVTGGGWPGIAGRTIGSIKDPAKTLLVFDAITIRPYSWHQPKGRPPFNDAWNVAAFVDGHANYLKIYWNATIPGAMACSQDPPAGYDYKWSGD